MSKLRDIVNDVCKVTRLACIQQHADTQGHFSPKLKLELLVLAFYSIEQKPQNCFIAFKLAKQYLPLPKTWCLHRCHGFQMQIDNLFDTETSSSFLSFLFAISLRQMSRHSHWICSRSVVDKTSLYADSILPHLHEEEKIAIESL